MKQYTCPKCGANCKPEDIIEEGVLCVNCKYDGLCLDVRRPIKLVNDYNCKEL